MSKISLEEVIWDEVDSSNIERIAHDEESKVVLVEFKSGAIWGYDDCDSQLYNQFKNAPSVGKFFFANIKNSHSAERLQG